MKSRHAITILLSLLACAAALPAQEPREQEQLERQEQPFDPYHAEKNIEIGMFYMKKGKYDAAIERFQEAARLKPNFARPYRLMGEAYEKKGEKAQALASYQKYLEILPSAGDAPSIRKRIAKLNRELERAARRRSR